VRVLCLAIAVLAGGCLSPDLSKICPYKPITQGVFGGIEDGSGNQVQNVEVDLYTVLNGQQDMLVVNGHTTRGGYQYKVDPSTYMLCVTGVCATVTVPTGLVELSGVQSGSSFMWDAPVPVPPEQMIGPCTYGD